MPIPRTAAEWDADADLFQLVKCYRGREWFHRLRLFAVSCCRSIWDVISPGPAREAVEAAERYALGQITLRELHEAGRRARAVVDATSETGDRNRRIHGSLAETVAEAAWACALPAEHPALVAPSHVLGVISKRRFEEVLPAGREEANRESRRAFEAMMAEMVALLRATVGNPFVPAKRG